jgi:hypothetical protein
MTTHKAQKAVANLLDMVPVPLVGNEVDPASGRVSLLVPRFKAGAARKLLGWLNRDPYIRLHLDQVGSFAWGLFDGHHTLGQVAEALAAEFGDKVQPAPGRLAAFVAPLRRNGFLELTSPGRPAPGT